LASNQVVTRSTSTPLMLSVMWFGLPRTPSPQVAEGIRAGTLPPMSIDVTDATFPAEVVERSKQVPVVVDLWAEWCGPCKTLGPILEKVVDETGGKVVLAKVDVDTNQQTAAAFQVQGIPAVYALKDGKVVDGFVGAQPEANVRQFVAGLLPTEAEDALASLLAAGDEASLRQVLEVEPGHEQAVVALAELLVARGDDAAKEEALALLGRIPESPETRRVAALARIGADTKDGVTDELDGLLDRVKDDDDARQRFIDLLEVMGPDDPRTAGYRKQLTAKLF
jgi:putative thioredoxin